MDSANICFVNNTPETVCIFWLDKDKDKETWYYSLKPYKSYIQPSYISHSWIIRTKEDKNVLEYFTAVKEHCICQIGKKNEKDGAVFSTQNVSYKEILISGFQVFIEPEVFESEPRLEKHLSDDLKECRKIFSLSKFVSPIMLSPTIFVNSDYKYSNSSADSACCCHWSERWLEANGNEPQKVGCVEIYNATKYVDWCKDQPAMLFHELCHALHWQFRYKHDNREEWIMKNELITRTFNVIHQSGKYEVVLHINGKHVRHYALTNEIEYFAECCEAFFSSERFRNDFYPFIHRELKMFDPDGFNMVLTIWGLEDLVSANKKLFDITCPNNYDPDLKKLKSK